MNMRELSKAQMKVLMRLVRGEVLVKTSGCNYRWVSDGTNANSQTILALFDRKHLKYKEPYRVGASTDQQIVPSETFWKGVL